MKSMHIFTLMYLIVLSGQARSGFSQGNADRIAKIDSFLTKLAASQLFNGSIIVTEHGQPIYQKSLGYLDFANRTPHTDTTRFNLASLSKPFTAIAVLQLIEKKKIKVEDPFIKFFPDFAYPQVTIRHLLNHTSGLPILERYENEYIKAHPNEVISNQQAYVHLISKKPPLLFMPGENWRYNNTNYLLLAMLVEKISGISFGEYMHKHLFVRAGMKKTSVRQPEMKNTTRYVRPNMYTQTHLNVDSLDRTREYTYYNLGSVIGPNNVISTIQDLWLFDQALDAGKLVSAETLAEAFKPVVLNSGKTFFIGASTRSYGLGWNVYTGKTAPFDHFVFHDGHIVGLSTVLHKNLSKDQTIILFDNLDNNAIQLMIGVSNLLNGLQPPGINTARSLARVYGETIVMKGPDFALAKFNELKSDTNRYYIDEFEINRLGFDLLRAGSEKLREYAVEVFKVNTLLFPNSSNTYDSYAHALAETGKKEPAIAMYRKSLELSPDNEDGKRALQRLIDVKD